MGPRFGPPPMRKKPEREKPKSLREMPKYWIKNMGSFFVRLFYIVRLVWETSPLILILMTLFCVFDGVLPVIGAYISKELLNEISALMGAESTLSAIAAGTAPISDLFGFFTLSVFALLCVYFGYQFVSRISGRISAVVNNLAGELVSNHIKIKIIEKAKTIDIASFDRPEFYEKLENANREAGMRPIGILRSTFNVISALITLISFVAILAALHPLAPVFIAVMALPGAILNYVYRNKQFWYIRHRSKERRQMEYFSGLVVNKDMAKEVRIMGLSDTFIAKYKQVFKKYFSGIRKLVIQEGIWQIVFALISLVSHLVLFGFIIVYVVNGGFMIGDYSLYTGALNSISSGVSTLITATASIYEGTLFIDNMMVFMKEEVKIRPNVDKPLIPQKHAPHTIEFKDVTFRYAGNTRDILSHVSFTIHSGENVVLVGLNGAGKTTLIKLLTRLYDPTEGVILLDGHDLREYDVAALYDIFGIIFQDFGKYAVSVSENIAFGDIAKPMDDEEIKKAAERGNASDFIGRLPNGFDTPLMRYFEENGIELSVGQWQKLSIARAFYKDSDILILDEPTASLDPLAEQEVFSQFSSLGENKISVFVSHRLSSATTADKIVVLNRGKLAEMGTHAELMEKKGEYYQLFSTQAKHYVSEGEKINDGADTRF